MPTVNNTIFFINKNRVPKHKKPTYGRIVDKIKPQKEERHRVRLTVVGGILDFDGFTATQCAYPPTTKILMNSTISTPGKIFMTMDLNDFYYGTTMS